MNHRKTLSFGFLTLSLTLNPFRVGADQTIDSYTQLQRSFSRTTALSLAPRTQDDKNPDKTREQKEIDEQKKLLKVILDPHQSLEERTQKTAELEKIFSRIPSTRLSEPLITVAQDPAQNINLRLAVFKALFYGGPTNKKLAQSILIIAANDEDERIRAAAYKSLYYFSVWQEDVSTEILKAEAKEKNLEIRKAMVWSLRSGKNSRHPLTLEVADRLIKITSKEANLSLRREAIRQLYELILVPEVREFLIQLAINSKESISLRRSAIYILGRRGPGSPEHHILNFLGENLENPKEIQEAAKTAQRDRQEDRDTIAEDLHLEHTKDGKLIHKIDYND